mgnify:CR=1 FL=1
MSRLYLSVLLSCCFAASAPTVSGQPLYVGIKGGLLLTDSTLSVGSPGRTGLTTYSLNLRRYSVGPSVEAGLPWRLRIESGFLYRRFDDTAVDFKGPSWWTAYRSRGNRWEVPVVVKREWGANHVRPFLGAGGLWSRVPATDLEVERFYDAAQPPLSVSRGEGASGNTGGWIVTGGLRFRAAGALKITPEVRFTRHTSALWLPSRNQVDFFLGLGF